MKNLAKNSKRQKIRVGLLLNSHDVKAWQYEMVRRIVRSTYAKIVLVIVDDSGPMHKSLLHKLWARRSRIIYSIYERADRRLLGTTPDAFAVANLRELLAAVDVVRVKPERKKYSDYFHQDDIDQIKKRDVDVLIRLGFRILRGPILDAARYGVWSYHHGDSQVNRGGPPGYWESVENWPTTGSILQILNEDLDAGVVLYRSWSTTLSFSLARNRANYYWKTLSFVPRKLEELYNVGAGEFFTRVNALNSMSNTSSAPIYRAPSNAKALGFALRQSGKLGKMVLQSALKRQQWILMFRFDAEDNLPLNLFKRLVPPRDRFWADPHIVHKDGKYYIFFEEMIFSKRRARISAFELDENGMTSEPIPVLDKDYHLSYPFIFEWQGNMYMIPESSADRSVQLYECIDFPYKWRHAKNLMENVSAVDSTLFRHDDKWWLFMGIREPIDNSHNDELYLFHSDDLFGNNWIPHPRNPIISDVRRARPAGSLYRDGENIYRPSQNCSFRYGYGFNINRITLFTESAYEEQTEKKILPDFDRSIKGIHTYNKRGRLTVVDALTLRSKFW